MTHPSVYEVDELAGDVDEQPPSRPGRAERLAASAGVAWRGLVDALGVFDWIAAAGVTMLLVGLWLWFGAGPALVAVGALVVWMGIAGGRAAARAETAALAVPVDDVAEPAAGVPRRGPVLAEVA